MVSLETGSNETGFSVDVRNRFLRKLKLGPVYSVDRPLDSVSHMIILKGSVDSNILYFYFKTPMTHCIYVNLNSDNRRAWSTSF